MSIWAKDEEHPITLFEEGEDGIGSPAAKVMITTDAIIRADGLNIVLAYRATDSCLLLCDTWPDDRFTEWRREKQKRGETLWAMEGGEQRLLHFGRPFPAQRAFLLAITGRLSEAERSQEDHAPWEIVLTFLQEVESETEKAWAIRLLCGVAKVFEIASLMRRDAGTEAEEVETNQAWLTTVRQWLVPAGYVMEPETVAELV